MEIVLISGFVLEGTGIMRFFDWMVRVRGVMGVLWMWLWWCTRWRGSGGIGGRFVGMLVYWMGLELGSSLLIYGNRNKDPCIIYFE